MAPSFSKAEPPQNPALQLRRPNPVQPARRRRQPLFAMGRGLEHELLVGILGHEQQLERSSLSVRWHLFFDLDQLRVLKVRDALAAIVLSAMVAAGCSSGDQAATRNTTTSTAGLPTATSPRATTAESATAPTNSSGRSAQSPSGLPLYDAIAHSLGYNLEVISEAVNRAQLDAIRKCLSSGDRQLDIAVVSGSKGSASDLARGDRSDCVPGCGQGRREAGILPDESHRGYSRSDLHRPETRMQRTGVCRAGRGSERCSRLPGTGRRWRGRGPRRR